MDTRTGVRSIVQIDRNLYARGRVLMAVLLDATSNRVLIERLEVANSFWSRFWGLQLRAKLPSDSGIWLSPCSSIHTCFMRFPIDVVMLDAELTVLGVRSHLKPWRAIRCVRGTVSVIETAFDAGVWVVGQTLSIQSKV